MIWFNEKEAYEQLMKHGLVKSLRECGKYPEKRNGRHRAYSKKYWLPESEQPKCKPLSNCFIGMVEVRTLIRLVPNKAKLNLSMYHRKESGFRTIDQWLSKLENPDKEHYLYEVKLLESEKP